MEGNIVLYKALLFFFLEEGRPRIALENGQTIMKINTSIQIGAAKFRRVSVRSCGWVPSVVSG